MKFVSYRTITGIRGGIVHDDMVVDLKRLTGEDGLATVMDVVVAGDKGMKVVKEALKQRSPAELVEMTAGTICEIELEAPIQKPGKILALAGNYVEHIIEGGKTISDKDKITPRIFMKPSTGLIGPEKPVHIPRAAQFIDWEGELAVVIGRKAKYVSKEDAMDYVFGYSIFHDVSERRLKIRERDESSEWDKFFDWLNGKWHDGFAPMGPTLITKDKIRDVMNLDIETRVNGNIEQNGNTGQMIFSVADIVHYASQIFTLEPGDIIATGTPSGVGHGKNINLKPGDVVEIEIEELGVLKNPFRAENR